MLKPKDVPQKISVRHKLHKHELDNMVAVMEAKPSLRQTPTQAEAETLSNDSRRTKLGSNNYHMVKPTI